MVCKWMFLSFGEGVWQGGKGADPGSQETWVLVFPLPRTSSAQGFHFLSYKVGIKITLNLRICEILIR